jgi:hypothetical protein
MPTMRLAALTAVTAVAVAAAAPARASPARAQAGHDDHSSLHQPSPRHSSPHGSSRHGRDYDAVWDDATKSERKAATELVESTRDAVARWEDVDAALADGYVARRRGVGAVHYPNFANRRDDAVLDPEHPESLVYLQRPNGDPILLGVVYIATRLEERPTPAGAIAAWHVHHADGCRHPDVDAGCSEVRGGMLHVWLYDGVVDPFADPMFASMGSKEAWRSKLFDLAGIERPTTRGGVSR